MFCSHCGKKQKPEANFCFNCGKPLNLSIHREPTLPVVSAAKVPVNSIIKLWRGEYGLAKTYWIFGVLINLLATIALKLVSNPKLSLILSVSYFPYLLVQMVGIWEAGKRYTGPIVWPVAAIVQYMFGLIVYVIFTYLTTAGLALPTLLK